MNSISSHALGGGGPEINISPDDPLLWTTYSIPEIRQLEQQTRHKSSLKEQELRQLVWESYRDVLSCADSMVEMAESSKKVVSELENLHKSYKNIQFLTVSYDVVKKEESINERCISFAKTFENAPEEIWADLDNFKLLKVARKFKKMQKLRSKTQSELAPHLQHLGFAVQIEQNCETIESLENVIVRTCGERLLHCEIGFEECGDALSAIFLLQSREFPDIKSLFSLFLKSRVDFVTHIITVTATYMEKNPSKNLTEIVCYGLENITKCLWNTVEHAKFLFTDGESFFGATLRCAFARKLEPPSLSFIKENMSQFLEEMREALIQLPLILNRVHRGKVMVIVCETVLRASAPSEKFDFDILPQNLFDFWHFFLHKIFCDRFLQLSNEEFTRFCDDMLTEILPKPHDLKGVCEKFEKRLDESVSDIKLLINLHTKSEHLKSFLEGKLHQNAVSSCCEQLERFLQAIRDYLKKARPSRDSELAHVLYLSKMCILLSRKCEALKNFLSQTQFNAIFGQFLSTSNEGFSLWCSRLSDEMGGKFRRKFGHWMETASLDDVDISKWKNIDGVRAPSHSSQYIMDILYTMTHELQKKVYFDREGNAHTDIIKLISAKICQKFFDEIKKILTKESISGIKTPLQSQLLFDFSFLFDILDTGHDQKISDGVATLKKFITKRVENREKVAEHIEKNVGILYHRCAVLFGDFCNISRRHQNIAVSTTRSSAAAGADNLIPLANSMKRIPTLPMAEFITKTKRHKAKQNEIKVEEYKQTTTTARQSGLADMGRSIISNVESVAESWGLGSVFGRPM